MSSKETNEKKMERLTGELTESVIQTLNKNKLGPIEGVTLMMNVFTYIVANSDLKPKKIIEFLELKMPDQVKLIRKDWEEEDKNKKSKIIT